jgi:ferrous iron transport protein B
MAIVKRETNSWKWPALQFIYMLVLAYAAAFVVNHVVTAIWG